jgi:hypothetical protein
METFNYERDNIKNNFIAAELLVLESSNRSNSPIFPDLTAFETRCLQQKVRHM